MLSRPAGRSSSATFAQHGDVLVVTAEVEIIDLDGQSLTDAHAGGVEQPEQQPVAVAGCGDGSQDGLDVLGGYRARGRQRQAGAV